MCLDVLTTPLGWGHDHFPVMNKIPQGYLRQYFHPYTLLIAMAPIWHKHHRIQFQQYNKSKVHASGTKSLIYESQLNQQPQLYSSRGKCTLHLSSGPGFHTAAL